MTSTEAVLPQIPRIVSVDDHVAEPADLWSSRLPKKYAEVWPRVIRGGQPYVKTGELATLQKEVRQEPREALDGGPEGVTLIDRLITSALPLLKSGGLLAMEIGEDEGTAVRELLTRAGYHDVKIEKDLAPHERMALGRAPSRE